MNGAQIVAVGKWSVLANASGLDEGFESISGMRGVLAAWGDPENNRHIILVLVFEPNDEKRIEIIDGVLRHFIKDVAREKIEI